LIAKDKWLTISDKYRPKPLKGLKSGMHGVSRFAQAKIGDKTNYKLAFRGWGYYDIQPHCIHITFSYFQWNKFHCIHIIFSYFQWNKFHCIYIGRAYGTGCMQLISSVGTTDIDAQGFNPEQ
jgi:hypothetical protein